MRADTACRRDPGYIGARPRTYGTFTRFLGKYVRDEKVTTLPDAIRRLIDRPSDLLSER